MRLLRFLTLLAVVWGGGHLAPASALAQGPDYGGLTPGPGREAVYFTCTACHSLQQFSQQRMSREEWDATLIRMVENNAMAEPEPWARTLMLAYLSTHFGVDEEDWPFPPDRHAAEADPRRLGRDPGLDGRGAGHARARSRGARPHSRLPGNPPLALSAASRRKPTGVTSPPPRLPSRHSRSSPRRAAAGP
jgi:hypothetical protein